MAVGIDEPPADVAREQALAYVRSLAGEPIAVCAVDLATGAFVAANPAAHALLEVSEPVAGRRFVDFVHHEDRDGFVAHLDRLTQGRTGTPIERLQLRRPDGRDLTGVGFATTLPVDRRAATLVLAAVAGTEPVTEPDVGPGLMTGGVITDERGFVRYIERGLGRFGYRAQDLVDSSVFLMVHPGDLVPYARAVRGLVDDPGNRRAVLPLRIRLADGRWCAQVAVIQVLEGREGEWGFAVVLTEPRRLGRAGDDPRLAVLTPREREVLVRLLGGDRVRTIARALYLSESTVRGHLSAAFRKLGVRSQIELTERFHRS